MQPLMPTMISVATAAPVDAIGAMLFADEVHREKPRPYTGAPYIEHLAEVAGIAGSAAAHHPDVHPSVILAVSWLHDSLEDHGVTHADLQCRFGPVVADGVLWLTDSETGNRAARKAKSRERLAKSPGWVQSIKCADTISNARTIAVHDPKFAVVYLEEKRLALAVMTKAHPGLRAMAMALCQMKAEATSSEERCRVFLGFRQTGGS